MNAKRSHRSRQARYRGRIDQDRRIVLDEEELERENNRETEVASINRTGLKGDRDSSRDSADDGHNNDNGDNSDAGDDDSDAGDDDSDADDDDSDADDDDSDADDDDSDADDDDSDADDDDSDADDDEIDASRGTTEELRFISIRDPRSLRTAKQTFKTLVPIIKATVEDCRQNPQQHKRKESESPDAPWEESESSCESECESSDTEDDVCHWVFKVLHWKGDLPTVSELVKNEIHIRIMRWIRKKEELSSRKSPSESDKLSLRIPQRLVLDRLRSGVTMIRALPNPTNNGAPPEEGQEELVYLCDLAPLAVTWGGLRARLATGSGKTLILALVLFLFEAGSMPLPYSKLPGCRQLDDLKKPRRLANFLKRVLVDKIEQFCDQDTGDAIHFLRSVRQHNSQIGIYIYENKEKGHKASRIMEGGVILGYGLQPAVTFAESLHNLTELLEKRNHIEILREISHVVKTVLANKNHEVRLSLQDLQDARAKKAARGRLERLEEIYNKKFYQAFDNIAPIRTSLKGDQFIQETFLSGAVAVQIKRKGTEHHHQAGEIIVLNIAEELFKRKKIFGGLCNIARLHKDLLRTVFINGLPYTCLAWLLSRTVTFFGGSDKWRPLFPLRGYEDEYHQYCEVDKAERNMHDRARHAVAIIANWGTLSQGCTAYNKKVPFWLQHASFGKLLQDEYDYGSSGDSERTLQHFRKHIPFNFLMSATLDVTSNAITIARNVLSCFYEFGYGLALCLEENGAEKPISSLPILLKQSNTTLDKKESRKGDNEVSEVPEIQNSRSTQSSGGSEKNPIMNTIEDVVAGLAAYVAEVLARAGYIPHDQRIPSSNQEQDHFKAIADYVPFHATITVLDCDTALKLAQYFAIFQDSNYELPEHPTATELFLYDSFNEKGDGLYSGYVHANGDNYTRISRDRLKQYIKPILDLQDQNGSGTQIYRKGKSAILENSLSETMKAAFGALLVVVNKNVRGFDVPSQELIIICRGENIRMETIIQMAGRITRNVTSARYFDKAFNEFYRDQGDSNATTDLKKKFEASIEAYLRGTGRKGFHLAKFMIIRDRDSILLELARGLYKEGLSVADIQWSLTIDKITVCNSCGMPSGIGDQGATQCSVERPCVSIFCTRLAQAFPSIKHQNETLPDWDLETIEEVLPETLRELYSGQDNLGNDTENLTSTLEAISISHEIVSRDPGHPQVLQDLIGSSEINSSLHQNDSRDSIHGLNRTSNKTSILSEETPSIPCPTPSGVTVASAHCLQERHESLEQPQEYLTRASNSTIEQFPPDNIGKEHVSASKESLSLFSAQQQQPGLTRNGENQQPVRRKVQIRTSGPLESRSNRPLTRSALARQRSEHVERGVEQGTFEIGGLPENINRQNDTVAIQTFEENVTQAPDPPSIEENHLLGHDELTETDPQIHESPLEGSEAYRQALETKKEPPAGIAPEKNKGAAQDRLAQTPQGEQTETSANNTNDANDDQSSEARDSSDVSRGCGYNMKDRLLRKLSERVKLQRRHTFSQHTAQVPFSSWPRCKLCKLPLCFVRSSKQRRSFTREYHLQSTRESDAKLTATGVKEKGMRDGDLEGFTAGNSFYFSFQPCKSKGRKMKFVIGAVACDVCRKMVSSKYQKRMGDVFKRRFNNHRQVPGESVFPDDVKSLIGGRCIGVAGRGCFQRKILSIAPPGETISGNIYGCAFSSSSYIRIGKNDDGTKYLESCNNESMESSSYCDSCKVSNNRSSSITITAVNKRTDIDNGEPVDVKRHIHKHSDKIFEHYRDISLAQFQQCIVDGCTARRMAQAEEHEGESDSFTNEETQQDQNTWASRIERYFCTSHINYFLCGHCEEVKPKKSEQADNEDENTKLAQQHYKASGSLLLNLDANMPLCHGCVANSARHNMLQYILSNASANFSPEVANRISDDIDIGFFDKTHIDPLFEVKTYQEGQLASLHVLRLNQDMKLDSQTSYPISANDIARVALIHAQLEELLAEFTNAA